MFNVEKNVHPRTTSSLFVFRYAKVNSLSVIVRGVRFVIC